MKLFKKLPIGWQRLLLVLNIFPLISAIIYGLNDRFYSIEIFILVLIYLSIYWIIIFLTLWIKEGFNK